MAKLSALDKIIKELEAEVHGLQNQIEANENIIARLMAQRPHRKPRPRVVKKPDEKTGKDAA